MLQLDPLQHATAPGHGGEGRARACDQAPGDVREAGGAQGDGGAGRGVHHADDGGVEGNALQQGAPPDDGAQAGVARADHHREEGDRHGGGPHRGGDAGGDAGRGRVRPGAPRPHGGVPAASRRDPDRQKQLAVAHGPGARVPAERYAGGGVHARAHRAHCRRSLHQPGRGVLGPQVPPPGARAAVGGRGPAGPVLRGQAPRRDEVAQHARQPFADPGAVAASQHGRHRAAAPRLGAAARGPAGPHLRVQRVDASSVEAET